MRGRLRVATLVLLSLTTADLAAAAQDLNTLRHRANSDDARNATEAGAHSVARATVIRGLEPNKLGVGGATFRVKRNPAGAGSFVYEPQTRFAGVERKLVWWVSGDGTAYAVNGASKPLTPRLEFPPQSAVQRADQIVAYVFEATPLPQLTQPAPTRPTGSFTVKEYHAYRLVIDTPVSVSEAQAHVRVGRCLNMTAKGVASTATKVQGILFQNKWMGRPADEVKHAFDWNGDPPVPKC